MTPRPDALPLGAVAISLLLGCGDGRVVGIDTRFPPNDLEDLLCTLTFCFVVVLWAWRSVGKE